jgi:hypothetical protein
VSREGSKLRGERLGQARGYLHRRGLGRPAWRDGERFMSESQASNSSETAVPFLVHILKFLASRYQCPDPALDGQKVKDALVWLTNQVHLLRGVPTKDFLETMRRLGNGELLEPMPRVSPLIKLLMGENAAHFTHQERDLGYVVRELYELDRDGVTAGIWRHICDRAPEIAQSFRAATLQPPNTGPGTMGVDKEDLLILRALKELHPRLLTQDQIESHSRVSRRTISSKMEHLRDTHRLVGQPNGPKKGTTITQAGLELLKQLDRAQVAR